MLIFFAIANAPTIECTNWHSNISHLKMKIVIIFIYIASILIENSLSNGSFKVLQNRTHNINNFDNAKEIFDGNIVRQNNNIICFFIELLFLHFNSIIVWIQEIWMIWKASKSKFYKCSNFHDSIGQKKEIYLFWFIQAHSHQFYFIWCTIILSKLL